MTISRLGYGAAPLGNLYRALADEDAFAAVDRAWAGGIRYFDTAPHYGLGLSETRLGAALHARPRGDYVISTKVGRSLEPNPAPTGSDLAAGGFDVPDTLRRRFDFSAAAVRRSLEESLTRLGLDRLDIALVHDPDEHLDDAARSALPELLRAKDEGLVGAVGIGTNRWQTGLALLPRAELDVVMLAGRWTLVDRSGRPLLDACAERGVSVIAAAPYNSGLLARPWPPDDAFFDYGPAPAELLAEARRLAGVCERHGITLPVAALQAPLRHPAVAAVVCGLRSVAEVTAAVERFRTDVPPAAWPELENRDG